MRWEVTRRNPYYNVCWRAALADHRREPFETQKEALFGAASTMTLWTIGVSGEPVDPALPFEALGSDQLNLGWLSGAVHPATKRGLAGILLADLPKETLSQLADIFRLAAESDDPEELLPKEVQALQCLQTAAGAGLDDFPDKPFVSIDPTASERKIAEAIAQLIKQWKSTLGVEDTRDRSDKFSQYLEAFDLREGWRDGDYDRTSELCFNEIARITGRTIKTLNNQYCRGFQLVTGSNYSREVWYRLFGPIKLSDLAGPGRSRTRRPTSSPTRIDVPDTTVTPGGSGKTSIIDSVVRPSELGFEELLMDIETMIELGRTNAEIQNHLGVDKEAIDYLRSRTDALSLNAQVGAEK